VAVCPLQDDVGSDGKPTQGKSLEQTQRCQHLEIEKRDDFR